MRYIRTPFSIFEVVEETDTVYRVKAKWTPSHTYSKSKRQTEVIKSANTIEELCDEIVEIIDGKAQVVYADISFNDLAIAKLRDKNNAIVYGAIWTDKGLIYVAKINDKGELELL